VCHDLGGPSQRERQEDSGARVRHIRCRFVRPLGLSPWDDISLNSTVAHPMSLYGSRLKRCPFVHTCVVAAQPVAAADNAFNTRF
jgi:hypothetical protein